MPWCDTCSRFLNPNSMSGGGRCPGCGASLGEPSVDAPSPAATEEPGEYRAPWHFWVFVVAAVAYLGWRVVQMLGWLVT